MKIENVLELPKLGFGLMRLPVIDDDGTNIDKEQVCRMADEFLEKGFIYFDTAYPYHSGFSELAVKEVLVNRHNREDFLLATKLPGWELRGGKSTPQEKFDEQLEKTGAGYFDFYLLHAIDRDLYTVYEENGCFSWGQEMKAQGKIRHFGFSYHDDAELLDRILTKHPDVDFVQLQINYLDWEDPSVQSRAVYEVCRKHDIPVVVMEPVKGGALADLPGFAKERLKKLRPDASEASWAMRFVASLPGVAVVLSGMSNEEQMRDNLKTMADFEPMSESEMEAVLQIAKEMHDKPQIGCTSCRYCVDGCPMKIVIPELFRAQNRFLLYGHDERGDNDYNTAVADGHGKASECIKCGKCEDSCPQHLPIRELLQQVAETYETA